MACPAWLVAGPLLFSGALAQSPSAPPPPPPPAPLAPSPTLSPAPAPERSGATILGRPGIRSRYVDPAAPAPPPAVLRLPGPGPTATPLAVPLNRTVDFTPTMEEGPFQRPTIRGLLRWDLQPTPSR